MVQNGRRSQQRSAATRERLLDAAAEAFIERGYERTTVADIARRASVTVGAIYGNYRGKSEILLKVIRSRLKLQNDAVEAFVKTTPDVNQAFVALTRGRNERGRPETRALLLEAFAAARRDPNVRAVVAELMLGMVRFMTSQIRAAQEKGLIDAKVHAPSLAWLYLIPAAGEAFAEASGLELPPQKGWIPVVERIAAAFAGPNASAARGLNQKRRRTHEGQQLLA